MARRRRATSPFRSVKPGDTVVRLLAGTIPMELVVSEVDERFIHCGGSGGWRFDRETGFEVDEEIGWGPEFGITGSYLLPPGVRESAIPIGQDSDTYGPAPDRVVFRTATGSRYSVNNVELCWRRTPTLASGRLRDEEGTLIEPVRPVVGVPAVLVGESYANGLGNRVVVTTPVVAIEPFEQVQE